MDTNPGEQKSVAVHEEIHKKEATVEISGTMKKGHRGRNLAAGHHGEPRERTRGNGGSGKKLAASCRGITCRVGGAQHKGNVIRKNRTRDNVEEETQKGCTLRKRKRTCQEGSKVIKDLGGRRPLYLRKERVTANDNRGRSSGQ
jgi:hypothetical protein